MLKVLLVDDDESIREFLSFSLSTCLGAAVKIAHSGNQAATLLDTHRFDVIVSDYSMPDGSGESLLSHVYRRGINSLFVFYSGSVPPYLCAPSGRFLGSVEKPNLLKLLATIEGATVKAD